MMEAAWRKLRLSVQIATKLNRSHLIPGEVSYLLPCLGRIEIDQQATGPQAVSMEDSTACIHGSRGQREPIGEHVRSEPFIVAGMAKATLPAQSEGRLGPMGRRLFTGARRHRGDLSRISSRTSTNACSHREAFRVLWRRASASGRRRTARRISPCRKAYSSLPGDATGIYRLLTVRADGQFNTTVYNEDDRFRGVEGGRRRRADERSRHGANSISRKGDRIILSTAADDGVDRRLGGLQVLPYAVPEGCLVGYYPECNGLIPLWHYAKEARCRHRSRCQCASSRVLSERRR